MTVAGGGNRKEQLRVWPGVVAVVLQWALWLVLPMFLPGAMIVGVIAGLAGGLAVLLWWLFFSRARWSERVGAVVLVAIAALATRPMLDRSIANGMMGMMFVLYIVPVLSLALVVWAVATRRLPDGARRAALIAAIVIACGSLTLLRTEGITGEGRSQLAWRWSPDPEQKLLARSGEALPTPPAEPARHAAEPAKKEESGGVRAALPGQPSRPATAAPAMRLAPPPSHLVERTGAEWPGFRGPRRDSVIRGVRINTDWASTPPVELWRRPVGPGWSSFAAGGGRVYTQEQRGDHEVVACYDAATGAPVWVHRDHARFWESNGGAGPRGTPTLHDGRLYALGATGILNALDAATGTPMWTRNAATDTGAKLPGWGFSGSPLVVDDLVVVAASGHLAAYDLSTGRPRWIGPGRGISYSSPQLLTIDGVRQVLLMSGEGATSVAPADGKVLWKHDWPGASIVQPAMTPGGGVVISTASAAGGIGTRRLAVAQSSGWTVKEAWTSNGLKPYFNDFVIHKGHAFGFDGSILAAIDLEDGKRKWKGGRYGHGQLLLLADQDLLLVVSEGGELALVGATTDQFTEVARFRVMDDKTWNHPVLVGHTLFVRNGREMVALRLPKAGG